MADLGPNLDAYMTFEPHAVWQAGSKWLRVVAVPAVDLTPWLQDVQSTGVKPLILIVNESSDGAGMGWGPALDHWRRRYEGYAAAWQVMNEPDAGWDPNNPLSAAERAQLRDADGNLMHESSWCMEPDEVTHRLVIARRVLGDDAYIVGPGLSSGHPEYADLVDWSPVNAMAIHPYAKFPGTPDLENMVSAYKERADAV